MFSPKFGLIVAFHSITMVKCDQLDLELLYKCLQIAVDLNSPYKNAIRFDLCNFFFFAAEVLQNMSIFVQAARVFADMI